jgi:hypothetical protein
VFLWDAAAGRYRTPDGRFVREEAVRRALDTVLAAQAATMRDLTTALIEGRLPLGAWQAQMMQEIKSSHLVGLATAGGGWNNLDQADFGWVGQRIRSQYGYLRGFAADLASGRQPLNGTALTRATMYAESARQTHRAAQQRLAKQRGLEQERNQLGAADHCAGCLEQTAKGWVEIGTLVPCGSRNCLSRCHCSLQYRVKRVA